MLTDNDLKKIGTLIDVKLDRKLNETLDRKLKPIKEDVVEIRKDIKRIVDFFDREYLELRARVERIEEHLNLKPKSSPNKLLM